jgi:zinc-binding lipoprotein adcA
MKKFFKLIFVLILGVVVTTGCFRRREVSKKRVIYTTFFPVYDLVKSIAGDKFDVRMIIKDNQEPHDFELKANDMTKIVKADLIVYNGASMENFIDDLKSISKDDNKYLDLSQGLTLLKGKDDDDHDDDHEEDKHHHDVNPHTWLSVKNAIIEADTIYNKLVSIDSNNKNYYKKNFDKLINELKELDKEFESKLSSVKSSEKYFVVSHAAFNYLAKDYNLKQVAVTGISPEDEPTAKQLKEIADFTKKHNIKTIFFEGKATPKVAETLAKNTGARTSTLYTMESLTKEEMKKGYVGLMKYNLEKLVESFNE